MRDFMSVEYVIRLEDPRQDDVIRMLSALDKYLQSLYPPESNHILDIAALCAPDIRFWVARREGVPHGCGALRIDAAGYGEVKRMYVIPEARGQNVGRAILRCIDDQAAPEGLALMRLETGIHQAAAHALYRSGGYAECAPFGGYRLDPLSVFMEKRL
jgi:putative acetyltransferase